MRKVFLGKPWHWALLGIISVLLYFAGSAKLHVIHFNTFIMLLTVGSLAVVLLIVHTTKPDEQVTREKLEHPDND